jgi:hypothetical protein
MVRWRIGLIMLAIVAAVAWLSVGDVMAGPVTDPIVRVRGGGNSIPILALPFTFDFGTFPAPPDSPNCYANSENGMDLVGCYFQNQTGMTISFLQLDYILGLNSGGLEFTAEDVNGLFATSAADASAATFTGGAGIPTCGWDGATCYGGEFTIELLGFPDDTTIGMTAASAVPDSGSTLLLLGLGMTGLAAVRRRLR